MWFPVGRVKCEGLNAWFVGRGVENWEFLGGVRERGSTRFLEMQAKLFENSKWEIHDWVG